MAVGIAEIAGVAAPKGVVGGLLQNGAIVDGAGDEFVDFFLAADIVGEGEAAEAGAAVGHAAIFGQFVERIDGQHHPAALEHGDGVEFAGLARPTHGFPEGDGAGEIVGSEGDDADALVHDGLLLMGMRLA